MHFYVECHYTSSYIINRLCKYNFKRNIKTRYINNTLASDGFLNFTACIGASKAIHS